MARYDGVEYGIGGVACSPNTTRFSSREAAACRAHLSLSLPLFLSFLSQDTAPEKRPRLPVTRTSLRKRDRKASGQRSLDASLRGRLSCRGGKFQQARPVGSWWRIYAHMPCTCPLCRSYESYYVQAQRVRRLVVNDFRRTFAQDCDAILLPTATSAAPTMKELDAVCSCPLVALPLRITFYSAEPAPTTCQQRNLGR